jgi:hypothetical protein
MRPVIVTAVASLASLTIFAFAATPSSALDGVAKPAISTTLVTRVADTAAPKRRMAPAYRAPRFRGPWHQTWYWQERMLANRWLHYQYVNSGFPVRHYPVGVCTSWCP